MGLTVAHSLLDAKAKELGFQQVDPTVYHSLNISTCAKEKEGKTTWAFTAPGPLGIVSTDTGTEEIAKPWVGKKAMLIRYFKSVDKLRQARVSKEIRQTSYESEWEKMKEVINYIIESRKFRTLIIDTATEAWELCRLAAFGKISQVLPHHYTEVNSEFKALVKGAYDNKNMNSIWIHKMGKEYKANSAGKENWTGRWERKGFGDMPFLVDCNVRHYFAPAEEGIEGISAPKPGRFGINIIDSRSNMLSVVGSNMEAEQCTFEELGFALYPDTYGTSTWR